MRPLDRNLPIFAEVRNRMSDRGTDADIARRHAVDEMLQFMRDPDRAGAPFNLKPIIEDGRA